MYLYLEIVSTMILSMLRLFFSFDMFVLIAKFLCYIYATEITKKFLLLLGKVIFIRGFQSNKVVNGSYCSFFFNNGCSLCPFVSVGTDLTNPHMFLSLSSYFKWFCEQAITNLSQNEILEEFNSWVEGSILILEKLTH